MTQPLTPAQFSRQLQALLLRQAQEKAQREGLDGFNSGLGDLNGWLSSAAKEIRRVGRRIDKNKDKIAIAAAGIATAVVGGPAILGAVKGAGAMAAGAAKSGAALAVKAGAATVSTAKTLGAIVAKPFAATPEEVAGAEEVVKSDSWYKKTFETIKTTLEKTTGIVFDSPESRDLLAGLVLGERKKILGALEREMPRAIKRTQAEKLTFIVSAAWLKGMNPAQMKEAGTYIKRYVALNKSLKPPQRAVYNDEIRHLVKYVRAAPGQKLMALREIDKLTQARIDKREALKKKPSLLVPAIAAGALLTLGDAAQDEKAAKYAQWVKGVQAAKAKAKAAEQAKAAKFFSAVMIQKVKNNPALKEPTLTALRAKEQTIAIVDLIGKISALPGPVKPAVVQAKPLPAAPVQTKQEEIKQARDEKMARQTVKAVSRNPELKEQVLKNLETVPQTPIVVELKETIRTIPAPTTIPIEQPLPVTPVGEEPLPEEKPPFDWAGIAIPLAVATIPFILS